MVSNKIEERYFIVKTVSSVELTKDVAEASCSADEGVGAILYSIMDAQPAAAWTQFPFFPFSEETLST
jgi:hypothetical protein